MRFISKNAIGITMVALIVVLLVGSWAAGQISQTGGHTGLIFAITFALMLPCAITLLYLQERSEAED